MKNLIYKSILFTSIALVSFGASSSEGINADLAILKINKNVKTLSNEVLVLKDEIEILRENQRLTAEKIDELLQMIELSRTNDKQSAKSIVTTIQPSKLFKDGKSSFVLGDYQKAIELFLTHLNTSLSDKDLTDTKLWLGRAYFFSKSYLESKNAYLDFQVLGTEHPKYADSLYELSKVHIELNENNEAKMILNQMLEDYPDHILFNKASVLIQSL
jgi:TolA-binding protein